MPGPIVLMSVDEWKKGTSPVKSGGNWNLYAQQRPGGLAAGGKNVVWKIT